MSKKQFERTQLIFGQQGMEKLAFSHVAVFGVGGVGGYAVETLVRAGIGEITIVDNDTVSETNLNRQIIALHSTVGKKKVDVVEQRALDINPDLIVHKFDCFFLPETASLFDFSKFDYVIDCVDTVTAKISIIESCRGNSENPLDIKVISCMGTGNKLNPMEFKIADIQKTKVCPLAKVMRHELKKRGIKGVKCVYSEELPVNVVADSSNGRHSPGSVSFVPPAAGLLLASTVIKDLIA